MFLPETLSVLLSWWSGGSGACQESLESWLHLLPAEVCWWSLLTLETHCSGIQLTHSLTDYHWEIQMVARVSLCQSRLFLFSRLNKIIKSISSSSTCATLWVSVLWPEAGDVSWGAEELFSVTFPSLLGENYTAVPWPAPISCFLFYTLPLSSITWMNYPGGVNQAWTTFYIRFMF